MARACPVTPGGALCVEQLLPQVDALREDVARAQREAQRRPDVRVRRLRDVRQRPRLPPEEHLVDEQLPRRSEVAEHGLRPAHPLLAHFVREPHGGDGQHAESLNVAHAFVRDTGLEPWKTHACERTEGEGGGIMLRMWGNGMETC
eukprot:gene3860-biopygen14364